jgi:hypothetical protein
LNSPLPASPDPAAPPLPERPLPPQWDLLSALAFLTLGSAVALHSWRMPRFEHLDANPYTVPGLVPGLLGLLLALLGLTLLLRSLPAGGWRLPRNAAPLAQYLRSWPARQLLWTLLLTLVYAGLLVGRIHFGLATFLFVTSFIILFERRSQPPSTGRKACLQILFALLQGLLVAVAVTLLFENVFLVRLP